jgi:DNA-binding PadR family transcriptional regulator
MLLEKRGFITASALTMSEVLYKITKDGREQLSRRL